MIHANVIVIDQCESLPGSYFSSGGRVRLALVLPRRGRLIVIALEQHLGTSAGASAVRKNGSPSGVGFSGISLATLNRIQPVTARNKMFLRADQWRSQTRSGWRGSSQATVPRPGRQEVTMTSGAIS